MWPFDAGWELKIETKINSDGFFIHTAIQKRLHTADRKCNTQTLLCIWLQRVTLSASIMFTFWALCYCSGQTYPGHETIKILWYIREQCLLLIFVRTCLTMRVSFVLDCVGNQQLRRWRDTMIYVTSYHSFFFLHFASTGCFIIRLKPSWHHIIIRFYWGFILFLVQYSYK